MNFLKPYSVLRVFERGTKKRAFIWKDEGIEYFGFKYYPRSPDFKDPPYEPTKLLRVQRIKPIKGCPYWEKNILAQLKIDNKLNDFTVVKNTPEINASLWKIKHLIRIQPITFPCGFPQDANGTYLKENGEMIITKTLAPVETKLIATETFKKDPLKLDGDTLRRDSRRKWDVYGNV